MEKMEPSYTVGRNVMAMIKRLTGADQSADR